MTLFILVKKKKTMNSETCSESSQSAHNVEKNHFKRRFLGQHYVSAELFGGTGQITYTWRKLIQNMVSTVYIVFSARKFALPSNRIPRHLFFAFSNQMSFSCLY